MMRQRFELLQKHFLTTAAIALSLCFTSCDIYYLDLVAVLKEHTEDVSIQSLSFDKEYPKDSDTVTCISSSGTNAITVNLINPQLLSLDTQVTLPSAAIALAANASVSSDNMFTITQSSDKATLTLTYTTAILTAIDGNSEYIDSTTETTLRKNDITPSFTFTNSADTSETFVSGPFDGGAARGKTGDCGE